MFGLQLLVVLYLVRGILAWWRMECPGALGLTRVDPIVSPGGPSQHLHSFHGSNGESFSTLPRPPIPPRKTPIPSSPCVK